MKLLNKLGILGVLAFAATACVEQEPEIQTFPNADVDFTYEVTGDSLYAIDYYVVSDVKFVNISAKEGSVEWDFNGAPIILKEGTLNDDVVIVQFEEAGEYNVTLTINGEYTRTYPILIYDIVPKVSIIDNPMVVLGETKVSFDVRLPNPGKSAVKYEWVFPAGAKDESGSEVGSLVFISEEGSDAAVECPKNITFSNLGSQEVRVKATYDYGKGEGVERDLETSVFNVQVASPIPAPTLYYAQVGGNVKAMKLIDKSLLPAGTEILPYDMGVRAGDNPFNLLYGSVDEVDSETGVSSTSHWIYILDAGKQYYYINDVSGNLGDGKITAMRTDGTNVNTVLSNVGGPAFSDPYQGCIYDGYIYYNDRNQGFSKIKMTDRGVPQENELAGETFLRSSYVAKNDLIPYYNRNIVYGAISNGLYRDKNGIWWWGKGYNGYGVYLFADEHIKTTAATALATESPYGILMSGQKFYCYAVDETNKKVYAWYGEGNTLGAGLVEFNLPDQLPAKGKDLDKEVRIVKMDAKPGNTTDSEKIYVKQLAVDEATGKVYFGFRPDETDKSGVSQGVAVYDPSTGKVTNYGSTNDEILGVAINPTLTQLF